MLRYILRRFLLLIVTMLITSVIVFGLTQIVWFIWLGIVMLRNSSSATA